MKYRRPTPQSKKDKRSAVLCGVGAILCLFNFKELWIFFLVFIACIALRIVFYQKHKASETELEKFFDEIEAEEGTSSPKKDERKLKSGDLKRERKEQYKKALADIEKEFDDFDYEDDYEDDDEE